MSLSPSKGDLLRGPRRRIESSKRFGADADRAGGWGGPVPSAPRSGASKACKESRRTMAASGGGAGGSWDAARFSFGAQSGVDLC